MHHRQGRVWGSTTGWQSCNADTRAIPDNAAGRRVEEAMMGPIRIATKNSARKQGKPSAPTTTDSPKPLKSTTSNDTIVPPAPSKPTKTDFEAAPKTRHLNDIVQAPPSLTKLPRNAEKKAKSSAAFGKHDVVSPEQKRMMEIEREKAIRRYREMKEAKSLAKKAP